MYTIEDQIKDVLQKVRPFLQKDGGDVEFVEYKDGVVYLRVLGACLGCAFLDDTITSGVEMILIEEVPGVVRVSVVE
ncbi:MAG: NifU family protein [Bacilli bacterium]|nr:NifU family protein [Bacilli bacterium]